VDLQNVDYYTIKRGDNISEIARDYNIKNATLRKLNGWDETFDKIFEGQVIKVPKPTVPEPKPVVHILLAGETFSDICTAYRVEPANLLKWNKLKADKMQWLPGAELLISETAYNNKMRLEKQVEKPESNTVSKIKGLKYTVRPGDTYYSIAKTYGITADELKARNNKRSDDIFPGEILVVFEEKE
jgi:membrane-bound lytic murein transglycosylase D